MNRLLQQFICPWLFKYAKKQFPKSIEQCEIDLGLTIYLKNLPELNDGEAFIFRLLKERYKLGEYRDIYANFEWASRKQQKEYKIIHRDICNLLYD